MSVGAGGIASPGAGATGSSPVVRVQELVTHYGEREILHGIDFDVRRGEIATTSSDDEDHGLADLVEQPAKVMRIGSMIKQLLDEVRESPLDEAARTRLRHIHQRSIQDHVAGPAVAVVTAFLRTGQAEGFA